MSVLTRAILLIALCLLGMAHRGMAASIVVPALTSNETSSVAAFADSDIVQRYEDDGLPSRALLRCRWGRVIPKYKTKYVVYKVFMSPTKPEDHKDWCQIMEKNLKASCGTNGGKSYRNMPMKAKDVRLTRCDHDGKDVLWERGYLATVQFRRWGRQTPGCVTRVVEQSLEGSVVDWMEHKECYRVMRSGHPALNS